MVFRLVVFFRVKLEFELSLVMGFLLFIISIMVWGAEAPQAHEAPFLPSHTPAPQTLGLQGPATDPS